MDTIIKTFDPMNPEHVGWLKSLHEAATQMSDGKSVKEVMNKHPWGAACKLKLVDTPEIHMMLAAKYVGAIFEKRAFLF